MSINRHVESNQAGYLWFIISISNWFEQDLKITIGWICETHSLIMLLNLCRPTWQRLFASKLNAFACWAAKLDLLLCALWLCVENLGKHSCRNCSTCVALACRLYTIFYLSIHSSGSPAHDREWLSHSLKKRLKAFQSYHSCISLLCMIVTI